MQNKANQTNKNTPDNGGIPVHNVNNLMIYSVWQG